MTARSLAVDEAVWPARRLLPDCVSGKRPVPRWSARLRCAPQAALGQEAARTDGAEILWKLKPCPSLADFHDQDLRDTAVTWMALGGATIPEIIAVTGHTAQSAHTILKHYLAQHPEMADSDLAKMVAWFDSGEDTGIV